MGWRGPCVCARCEMDDHLGSPTAESSILKRRSWSARNEAHCYSQTKIKTKNRKTKKEKRKQTQTKHEALSVCAQFKWGKRFHFTHAAPVPSRLHKHTWQLDWGLPRGLISQTVPAQYEKPECWKANWQRAPSTTMQENSCPIIGICIFFLIVLLQNTSVKLQRIYLTPIADRLFLHHLPKQCFVCLLFYLLWELSMH